MNRDEVFIIMCQPSGGLVYPLEACSAMKVADRRKAELEEEMDRFDPGVEKLFCEYYVMRVPFVEG